MSDKKKNKSGTDEYAPFPPKKAENEPTQTVYTHGKVFRIPKSQSLADFLREKYPEEYRK